MATISPSASTPVAAPAAGGGGDPPMAFAIMRNSHESFRAAIKEMTALSSSPSNLGALASAWEIYYRFLRVHADMEDFDMFPLLSSVDAAAMASADLAAQHVLDHSQSSRENAALSALRSADGSYAPDVSASDPRWEELLSAYSEWSRGHVSHFELEEKVMMPLTQKIAATPKARAKVAHDRLVTPAMSRDSEAFVAYMGWCAGLLAAHGSTSQSAEVATRVFVRGLHSASSASQWSQLSPALQSSCGPLLWDQFVSQFRIDEAVGDESYFSSQQQQPSPSQPSPSEAAPQPSAAAAPVPAVDSSITDSSAAATAGSASVDPVKRSSSGSPERASRSIPRQDTVDPTAAGTAPKSCCVIS